MDRHAVIAVLNSYATCLDARDWPGLDGVSLGNYEIRVDGDHAEAVTKARVIHVGAGSRAALTPCEAIGDPNFRRVANHSPYVRSPHHQR
ncbi:hypothetical protein [Mycobacterium sp. JS623]|uniref:hypothetical protein n=1 Tax=Mycobacterium sp. JS623 TaxID=212767 RepID=UPI00030E17BE|nr:hypothetical protein [Mycobacterium sp. JS623]